MSLPDLTGTPWRYIILRERDDTRCLVDAVDYEWLAEFNWNVWWSGRRGSWQLYAKRNVGANRATMRMHREILRRIDPRPEKELAGLMGDHANRQTLDNRRANLRWLSVHDNNKNRGAREQIPSLELIVMSLLHQARPAREALATLEATF